MQITWLGHSAFRLQFGGATILIDPFLKGNPAFEGATMSFDQATEGTTHVLLTHGHDDHIGSTVEICQATGATLYAGFELGSYLAGKGVANVELMNPGGTVAADGFKVSLTDALHSSSSEGVYLGTACGVVVTPDSDAPAVYHMGDTDVFPGMSLINEFYQPEIGLVPIGDRFTMGAKGAAYACRTYFHFKHILPCHYGTFPIIDQTADAFVDLMTGHRVHVPKPGETIEVD